MTKRVQHGCRNSFRTAQIGHFSDLTRDLPQTYTVVRSGADGTINLTLPMNSNDVVPVKLVRSKKGK